MRTEIITIESMTALLAHRDHWQVLADRANASNLQYEPMLFTDKSNGWLKFAYYWNFFTRAILR